ncbi:VOC family protein [Parasphingorhabdus sp.]|uniref:VOC family protein n=1 Tax=Parasphingorhabdus sp. TaxID=2709688 RepID=UPI003264D0C8
MRRLATGLSVIALLSACGSSGPQTDVPPDSIITGVSYIGASVSDLEKTAELYGGAVDLTPVDAAEISDNPQFDTLAGRAGVQARTQMMRSVNAQIRFMKFGNPSPEAQATSHMDVQGPGIAHVCYQVNQDTQAYQKFLAGGAKHIGDEKMVHLNPKNPVFYAYARDRNGLISEIEHVDVSQLDLPEPPKNRYRIRHVSLATPDMDRMVEFYSAFLDQHSPRRVGKWMAVSSEKIDRVSGLKDSKVEMAWFQVRNLELEIFQYHSHPTEDLETPRPVDALGYNMIVFDVSDMAAARKRLVDAGGTVMTEPGPMDGGEIMFGRDPDGNLIGLQTSETDSVVSSQNFENNGI